MFACLIELSRNELESHEAKPTEAGASLTALENFVEGTPRVNLSTLMPHGSVPAPSIAPDYPNKYWERPGFGSENEKSILIQEMLHSLPEEDVVSHIYDVFVTRCQGALGNIFHTPTFLKDAARLRSWISSQAVAPETQGAQSPFSMETLGCFLLAVCPSSSRIRIPCLLIVAARIRSCLPPEAEYSRLDRH